MAELMNFTDELLESSFLFCADCKNILNPPIMLVEDIGNICRICYEKKQEEMDWDGQHNSALEKVLTSLKLPCKYKPKGCSLRLSSKDLNIHQSDCKYRTEVCLMLNVGCDWEGSAVDFVSHFRECHGDHVINSERNLFVLEASISNTNMVKLLVIKKRMFMLKMQANTQKNKLYYMICSFDDVDSSLCEYSVKHKGESENCIETKSKIVSSCHIYNEFNENIAGEIDLDILQQISHISGTITNLFKIKLEESSVKLIDDKILTNFECPVCNSLMKPPILQCSSGHSICKLCKPKLQNCPICRSAVTDTRNYALEHLTAFVQYPCVHRDSGCLEIGIADYIEKHESDCVFKLYNCPVPTCTSHGNHDFIVQHLIHCHSDSVTHDGSKSYTVSCPFNWNSSNPCKRIFIIICNDIFRITWSSTSKETFIAAEVVGRRNVSKTFIYEVSIIDVSRPENKWIRTDDCLIEIEGDQKNSIVFHNDHLSPYSNDNMVKFNVSIKEK